jgi:molybdopterin converting factor small subunit
MTITIHYLAQLKRALGVTTETLDLPPGSTLGQLVDTLRERHAAARDLFLPKALVYFVNDEHVDPQHALADRDEVTILAPMAGGSLEYAH